MRYRSLVFGLALCLAVLPLGGCWIMPASGPFDVSIRGGSSPTIPYAQVKLTPAETTAIKAAMNGLTGATNALAQVPTIAAGATYVQVIESCLNVIVGIAATIPVIPEPYHTSLVVAALALPPLETLVGLAVQQGTALYATIKAKRMTAAPIVPAPVNAPLVPPPSALPTGG